MANSSQKTVVWSFEWDRGQAQVSSLGGMLAPIWFVLPNGRKVQPMHIAPWADRPDTPSDLPGILKRLRGEWPCVPFGMPTPPDGLPSEWSHEQDGFPTDPHGFAANNHWHLRDHFGTGIEIAITYPSPHPVSHLVRRISGQPGRAGVAITLEIHMRIASRLPIGVHPVFALPETQGTARLSLPVRAAHAYPVPTEPGVSRLKPGTRAYNLDAMPMEGATLGDLTRLPLSGETEELVQVAVSTGHARLERQDAGYTIDLRWNAAHFPFCLLWISNRGRAQPPWNTQHCALGVEPVAAAFDLGVAASRAQTSPLTDLGATALDLSPDTPFETSYEISVF